MDDKLLSIEHAAAYLGGISIWTVRAWLTQGRLRKTKIGGRTMIKKSELDRMITQGESRVVQELEQGSVRQRHSPKLLEKSDERK